MEPGRLLRHPGHFRSAPAASRPPRLQRLDLDLAEFDHALVAGDALVVLEAEALLQGDAAVGELAVLRVVDGLLAVEHYGEGRSLGRDLVDVPFARRLRHRIDLADIDDGAGAVFRSGTLVPDVDFVGGLGADFLGVGAADEDAAVHHLVGPEFGAQLEVAVAGLRDEEAVAFVGNDRAVFDSPVGVTHFFEIVEILAVEQCHPAGAALCGGGFRERDGGEQ